MTHGATLRPVEARTPEPEARLILAEEGCSAAGLAARAGEVETTAVVCLQRADALNSLRRVEHRIAQLERSGRMITEVIVLITAESGEASRSLRLGVLRLLVRRLRGLAPEVVLVLPAHSQPALRTEIFELTELVMAERGPGVHIRLRFAGEERRQSGVMSSRRPVQRGRAGGRVRHEPRRGS